MKWALVVPIVAITSSVFSADVPGSQPRTTLGVHGSQFTLNGKPTFLLGISYYGALGASEEFIRRDLDDMQRYGFNWIRVWANWASFSNNVAAVTETGERREPLLSKLKWLVTDCDRRGIIVDVSFSRGNGVSGPPRLQNLHDHQRAVETVITVLKPHRNWYLDLSNERNIGDKRFTRFEDLKALRALVRRLDAERLVTASHGGDIGKEELRDYLQTAGVDFISPHRPRDPDSAANTAAKTRDYLDWMKELSRVVPVHYQEPFRRGYGKWQPKAEDFVADLRAAKAGGAVGWCFHNGDQRDKPNAQPRRSFDLSTKRLFEQLDPEEKRVLELLKSASF